MGFAALVLLESQSQSGFGCYLLGVAVEDPMGKRKTRGGRGGGSWSIRQALKLARAAGLEVFDKPKSSLVVVRVPGGDRISFSKLEHNVTRNVKAWLLDHGCGDG